MFFLVISLKMIYSCAGKFHYKKFHYNHLSFLIFKAKKKINSSRKPLWKIFSNKTFPLLFVVSALFVRIFPRKKSTGENNHGLRKFSPAKMY